MAVPTTYPSGFSTGVNGTDRTFVEPPESIGRRDDATATEQSSTNSAFALARGMLAGLGISAGSGAGVVNDDPHVHVDPLVSLGEMSDTAASGSADARWTAVSLLKGILAKAGI